MFTPVYLHFLWGECKHLQYINIFRGSCILIRVPNILIIKLNRNYEHFVRNLEYFVLNREHFVRKFEITT